MSKVSTSEAILLYCGLIIFDLEPIEQNVQQTGHKGVYELTFIEQITRSLERF